MIDWNMSKKNMERLVEVFEAGFHFQEISVIGFSPPGDEWECILRLPRNRTVSGRGSSVDDAVSDAYRRWKEAIG